jgi:diacylglycerol kinase (CTP)
MLNISKIPHSLSWADTAASTFGRLWGRRTPALPKSILGLPLAPRKSLAGFLAASVTGGLVAAAFWGSIAPSVGRGELIWTWNDGVAECGKSFLGDIVGDTIRSGMNSLGWEPVHTGGWAGLGVIGIVAGLVSGVAEALGTSEVTTSCVD